MTRAAFYIAAAVLGGVGLLTVTHVMVGSYEAEHADFVRAPQPEISRHPERVGIAGLREISISAGDGSHIAGWYAPSRNQAAVLLIHGTESDRSTLVPETRILAEAGFGVLAVDMPGQGASDGQSLWGISARNAIAASSRWLSHRDDVDPSRIGAFGKSMGAYVLTQAAIANQQLRALILAGCPTDIVEQNWVSSGKWGLISQLPADLALHLSGMPLDTLPINVIQKIAPRPVFILGGEHDSIVPPYMARQLFARAGNPKTLWIVSGAHHVDYSAIAPQEYGSRLIDFYRRTLLN